MCCWARIDGDLATAATGAAAVTRPHKSQGWGLRTGEQVLGTSIGGWRCCWRSACTAPACNETISESQCCRPSISARPGAGQAKACSIGRDNRACFTMVRALGTNLPMRGRGRLLGLHALLEVALVLRLHLVHQHRLRHGGLQVAERLLRRCQASDQPSFYHHRISPHCCS